MSENKIPTNLIEGVIFAAQKANDVIIAAEQNTIESYLDEREKWLNKEAIELEKSLGANYISGEISLVLDEDDHFHLEGVLYFKKAEGPWVKKELRNKSAPMAWSFTPTEQDRLRSEKIIKFHHQR